MCLVWPHQDPEDPQIQRSHKAVEPVYASAVNVFLYSSGPSPDLRKKPRVAFCFSTTTNFLNAEAERLFGILKTSFVFREIGFHVPSIFPRISTLLNPVPFV